MNAEIQNAYESCQKVLALLKKSYTQYTALLDKLAKAEANMESMVSFVARELDDGGVSKTALPQLVKGDSRVLEAKADVNKLKKDKEAYICRVDFLKAQYDLEKKRMQAEMDEANRLNFKE